MMASEISTNLAVVIITLWNNIQASPVPITYTREINDVTDLILERTRQIIGSHKEREIDIPDLDVTFKQGITKPNGSILAKDGKFFGLDTLIREGDAFLIKTGENTMKLVSLMKLQSMAYYYNDYKINVNNTYKEGSLNVGINNNLIKMDLNIAVDEECSFDLTDLNIKIANNYTIQMTMMEMREAYYRELIDWVCENYITIISDTVRKVLYSDINQAIHDLEICNFIISPNGLADLMPKKELNPPFLSFTFDTSSSK
uniref:Lipid-binding serum glycoprotein N-terminal domain-containing protein n=1 Tax=Clastoptera arizonana TaxID=38151 RepID=A0A1B6BYT8_9HEMI